MTTLFPQIKRVDEDETSKIIKNVLFNNQDDSKLDKILEEFMHLTEELPYSDIDDDLDDVDIKAEPMVIEPPQQQQQHQQHQHLNVKQEQQQQLQQQSLNNIKKPGETNGTSKLNNLQHDKNGPMRNKTSDHSGGENDDNDNDDDDDDSEEDDDDDDDEDSEDDDDDDDDDDDSSDESAEEQQESTPPREPTSWNLDQFINSIPAKQTKQQQQQQQQPQQQKVVPPAPAPQAPKVTPVPQVKKEPRESKESRESRELKQLKELIEPREPPQAPATKAPPPQAPPAITPTSIPTPIPTPTANNNVNHHNHHREPSPIQPAATASAPAATSAAAAADRGSCLVQIPFSKLKRVPTTKAPTPNVTGSNSQITAKALKHEADAEKDKTKQAIKYLESSMYFLLHGQEVEATSNDQQYYVSVAPLLKHVLRMSAPNNLENQDNMTNLKIHALALKCMSLLQMKMYKSRERELPELAKTVNALQTNSPIQQADEVLIGVKPRLLLAYKRQVTIFNYLKTAHDHWHNVEHLCDQHPALRIFFSTIESNCGLLTMVSPFPKLMDHVQCGLKLLRTS